MEKIYLLNNLHFKEVENDFSIQSRLFVISRIIRSRNKREKNKEREREKIEWRERREKYEKNKGIEREFYKER